MPDESAGYWSALEPFCGQVNIYDGPELFLATYRGLPEIQRVLYAAHYCESEVSNGGLHQFFFNDTGVLAPEALEAFRILRLEASSHILAEAMSFFGDVYPRDRATRVERLAGIVGEEREDWDPFFQLDDRFYESLGAGHRKLFDRLDAFAKDASIDAG
jgi:uncharacterized protein DUF4375